MGGNDLLMMVGGSCVLVILVSEPVHRGFWLRQGAQEVTLCVRLPSVPSAESCLKLSIFIILTSNQSAVSQQSVSRQSAVSQQSVSRQSAVSPPSVSCKSVVSHSVKSSYRRSLKYFVLLYNIFMTDGNPTA